jgi:hypothetical protein
LYRAPVLPGGLSGHVSGGCAEVCSNNMEKLFMKLVRRGFIHCAYLALLIESGACAGSTGGQGAPGQVEATGESLDLRFAKKHKKKKHKKDHQHHHDNDGCEPTSCENIELKVDSHKHREDSAETERPIRVQVPQSLPALYWGSELEAELVFEEGDSKVVCTYAAPSGKHRRLFRSLELESCDNGAKASDIVTTDRVTLSLECSSWAAFAKVHVKLPEVEPCGEVTCDPADVDDGNPCTIDTCDADGGVTHTAAEDGTSCDDGNVCNGKDCCQAGTCVSGDSGPMVCTGPESQIVFTTDFESDTVPSEIDAGTAMLEGVEGYEGLGTAPRKFAGSFLRSPTGNRVTLQLAGLPEHDKLDLHFLFGAIDSLDGTGPFPAGELFIVRVDDVVVFSESFANALENQVQSYVPPDGVELARRVPLGFLSGDIFNDSAYDLGKDPVFSGIVHTAATATVTFEMVGPGIQPMESWAMENLEVSVSNGQSCEDCGSAPPELDDNNPCTIDSCDAVEGVLHQPAIGLVCGDAGNACVGASTCNAAGECVAGAPVNCDDGQFCTGKEGCDPTVGCTPGVPEPDSTPCGDDLVCDGAGECVPLQ